MINYYSKVMELVQKLQEDVIGLYNRVLELRQKRLEALSEASNSIPDLQDKIDRYGVNSFLEVDDLFFNNDVRTFV